MSLTKKDRAIIAIEQVERGEAEVIRQTNSYTIFVPNQYPNLIVRRELEFGTNRPYLKRSPPKERELLVRAISSIVLHEKGLGAETFLIESDRGLYLVEDRLRQLDEAADFSELEEAIESAGLDMSAIQIPLNDRNCGYAYEEVS